MAGSQNLGEFIQSLYVQWGNNRKDLEAKWERNWNAFKCELDRFRNNKGNKKEGEAEGWRSDTCVDITRQKVIAAMVLVKNVILAGGEIPFMLKKSKLLKNLAEKILSDMTDESNSSDNQQNGDIPDEPVEKMTRLIKEQFSRAKADRIAAKTIFSSALYGEAITKVAIGDYSFNSFQFDKNSQVWESVHVENSGLALCNISVWDFFTDIEDADVRTNTGSIQRQTVSIYDLSRMFSKDDKYVIKDALKKVIKENQNKGNSVDNSSNLPPAKRTISERSKNLTVLEFWGRVPAEIVRKFEESVLHETVDKNTEDDVEEIEIMVTVCGSEVIRYSRTDIEDRPFFRNIWQDVPDDVVAMSVADNMQISQDCLNSSVREFEDNNRLCNNLVIARKARYIENKDDKKLFPGKIIDISDDCSDARAAIQAIQFPPIGNASLNAISLYERWANNSSMIPEISQGLAPQNQATAYEISVRNEQSGKYVSDSVRNFDEQWIEPIGTFFYRWDMMDPEIPNEFKDACDIQALGFTSYQDKVIKLNKVQQMIQMALSNPDLSQLVNVRALFEEWIKANDLDVDKLLKAGGIEMKEAQAQQQQAAMQQQLIMQEQQIKMAKAEAEIQKLYAEVEKIRSSTIVEQEGKENDRAKLIADIETKNRADKVVEIN